MKKLTDIEAQQLFDKEAAGETLTKEEEIALMRFNGLSDDMIKEIFATTSPEYGKPDKDGITAII